MCVSAVSEKTTGVVAPKEGEAECEGDVQIEDELYAEDFEAEDAEEA